MEVPPAVEETLEVLGPLLGKIPAGKLTDGEREALETAEALLKVAGKMSGDHPILRVAGLIPWSTLAALLVTWRRVVANADALVVEIGELGPGVEIEAAD